MSAVYEESAEVAEIGIKLIKKHHPHLGTINIGYLFRSEAPVSLDTKGGMHAIAGMASRVDDKNYVFGGRDAIIQISKDLWQYLDDASKEILVDHELCHIGVKMEPDGRTPEMTEQNRPAVGMIKHDIEEFEAILDRYPSDHKKFRDQMKQFLVDKAKEKEAAAARKAQKKTSAQSVPASEAA